mmetsp:Transcript_28476/g.62347  ORF Transcript_28476/g.62347 Transcript_28476/m.62347 type:complete len:210 (-) Transcript_28476:420-1049(-)
MGSHSRFVLTVARLSRSSPLAAGPPSGERGPLAGSGVPPPLMGAVWLTPGGVPPTAGRSVRATLAVTTGGTGPHRTSACLRRFRRRFTVRSVTGGSLGVVLDVGLLEEGPQALELAPEGGAELGVVGHHHVLVVAHHRVHGPVEGPVQQQPPVHQRELVMHVVLRVPVILHRNPYLDELFDIAPTVSTLAIVGDDPHFHSAVVCGHNLV